MPATILIRSGIAERVWQSRDVDLPQPDPHTPHLADVVPSVLAAMGVAGFDARIDLAGEVRGACVLLIDGLGAELLDTYADDAPVMAALRGQTLQAGFPSTTVAGLAAVGTGCRSGEHGMVGLSFRLPGVGVFNTLRWRPHPWGDDLRDAAPPEQVQPMATTFERAASAGVAVSVVSGAEFTGSGLTRAVLRGGRYVGVQALGDLAAGVRAAVVDGGFCYGYHGEVDLLGHLYGPGSPAWRLQLREVDRLVESIVEGLPPGGLLAVVADHGMVAVADRRWGGHRRLRPAARRCAGDRRGTAGPARLCRRRAPPKPCSRRGGRRSQTVRGWCRVTKRSRRDGSVSGSATRSGCASAMSSLPRAARRPWFGAQWNRWSLHWSAITARSRLPSSTFLYYWPTADPAPLASSSIGVASAGARSNCWIQSAAMALIGSALR